MIVGEINVVPKHYWEGKDANGKQRSLGETTVEPPLGNGAYKIKSVDTGRKIIYERVPDYWAKDLPVMRGQQNFDTIEYTYYRDRTPAFEDFKTGRIDLWSRTRRPPGPCSTSFDALKKGLVKKEAIPVKRVAPMQAFVFNLRRKAVSGRPRERTPSTSSSISRKPTRSCSSISISASAASSTIPSLQAKGLPQGRELDILNEMKSEVPPEVFTTEWKNPVNAQEGDYRKHQQEALKLFEAAGWKHFERKRRRSIVRHLLQDEADDRTFIRPNGARAAQRRAASR